MEEREPKLRCQERVFYGIKVAMNINKMWFTSNGQSLKHVRVYLPTQLFSYDQLYVALPQEKV